MVTRRRNSNCPGCGATSCAAETARYQNYHQTEAIYHQARTQRRARGQR